MAVGTILCALFSQVLALVYPKLTQFVIDDVIGRNRADLLTPVMLSLLGAFVLRDLFNSLRILINNTFEQNVIYDMRRHVYARLQRLPVNYFDQRASGDLMTRVIEDVNAVERVLIDGTEQGSVAVVGIVGVITIMFLTNPTLAWVSLAPLPLLAFGAIWYTTTAHKRYRAQREAASAMNALLMDNLQGVRQIKAFEREPHEDSRFAQRADDLRKGTLGIMRVWAAYSPAMSFAAALGMLLVLWVGGHQMLLGKMKIGELVAFTIYLGLFYEPVARLHGLNQMLQAARAAGERIFDILDFPVERADARARRALPAPVAGDVAYDSVSFGYNSDRPVLQSISLHARPGEMIALVGPTVNSASPPRSSTGNANRSVKTCPRDPAMARESTVWCNMLAMWPAVVSRSVLRTPARGLLNSSQPSHVPSSRSRPRTRTSYSVPSGPRTGSRNS